MTPSSSTTACATFPLCPPRFDLPPFAADTREREKRKEGEERSRVIDDIDSVEKGDGSGKDSEREGGMLELEERGENEVEIICLFAHVSHEL